MNWKSVGAVIAGALFVIVVTTLVDVVLHAAGAFPPWNEPINNGHALLATSYRIIISIAGAWLTARLAPANPMRHAMILGALGVVMGLVGVIATWNLGLGPRWYPISLVVLALPQTWAGARLYQSQYGDRDERLSM